MGDSVVAISITRLIFLLGVGRTVDVTWNTQTLVWTCIETNISIVLGKHPRTPWKRDNQTRKFGFQDLDRRHEDW